MKNKKLVKFSLRRILVALDGSEHSKKAVELTLALAKKKRVGLIVMGNRGQGRFSKVFMGSVSTKVCNHAHCTCITVK